MRNITIAISVLLLLFSENLFSQIVNTNDHRRFALSFGVGKTQGFDRYEVIGEDHPDINYINPTETNFAIGFTWFHKNRWFTSLHYHEFQSTSGMSVSIDVSNREDFDYNRFGKYITRSYNFSDYSLRIGRTHFLKNPKWQTRWLLGTNLKHVSHRPTYGSANESDDPFFSLSQNSTPKTRTGIAPSLQAGYQIAYRGKRMGLSLMALGNLGLKYYALDEFEIWIDYEQYNTTINTRDDLIAWILQYEIYFGNTSSRR